MKLSESEHGGLWITEALEENQFFVFIMCKWLISEENALTLACLRRRSCLILPEGYQSVRWDYSYASGISKHSHSDPTHPQDSPPLLAKSLRPSILCKHWALPLSCVHLSLASKPAIFPLTAFLCLNEFFKVPDWHPVSSIWVQLKGKL